MKFSLQAIFVFVFAISQGAFSASGQAQDRMPDFLAGKTFTGVGLQTDGQSWQANFEFSEVKDPASPSKVINKTVACEANLFAVEVTDKSVVFKERITKGKDICLDLGYIEVLNDNITGLIILSYAPLRTMQPVLTQAVLFPLNDGTPPQADMKNATAEYAPLEPSIIGSWQMTGTGSFLWPRCDEFWPRDEKPWLPYDARGGLSVWAIPTEEGGKIFAAYAEDITGEKIVWTEIRHWNESSFVADKGFLRHDRRVFLDADKTPGGEDRLVIAPEGSESFSRQYGVACPAAQLN